MAWGVVIVLYSIAGAIFLLKEGQFFFFVYPEWQIYGGIGFGIAAIAGVNVVALSNRSYIWTRVCKFLWPFIIVTSGIRAILMIVELQRGESKIQWECEKGGVLWTASAEANYGGTSTSFPPGFCVSGYGTMRTAFIFGLLIDIGFQLYMFFMCWRFSTRLEHYQNLQGPYGGGYYKA